MNQKIKALKTAIPYTFPILASYIFLGFSYGLLMTQSGFSTITPIIISTFVYAGSMQFVSIELLASAFNPIYTFILTIMVNARHIFYGLSMLKPFENTGRKKLYLIYGLCDETFLLNYAAAPPEDVDRGWFMFFITFLHHFYWVVGTALGAIAGNIIHFNTKGIDFALTCLFVVMFLDQWESAKEHLPIIIGLGASVVSLIVFGSDSFLLPAMLIITIAFAVMWKKQESKVSEID